MVKGLLNITEVRVYPYEAENGKLKAFATITFDNAFVIRNLKVISGKDGLFVAMPSQKLNNGEHRDIAHPVTTEAREYIQKLVLDAYDKKMKEVEKEGLGGTETASKTDVSMT